MPANSPRAAHDRPPSGHRRNHLLGHRQRPPADRRWRRPRQRRPRNHPAVLHPAPSCGSANPSASSSWTRPEKCCSARASATHRGDCKELDGLTLTRESLALGVHPLNTTGFNSTITSFTPRGNSSYHGLASQVTKRYPENFAMTGAYTWSKNIDDSTAALASTVLTPRRPYDFENLRQERANSAAVIASLPLGFMTLLGCAIARRGRCGT